MVVIILEHTSYRSLDYLDAQQEAFKNAQQRYTFEAITSFEFDQVRNRLVNAESALIRAKYDYVFKSKVLKFYYGESVLD